MAWVILPRRRDSWAQDSRVCTTERQWQGKAERESAMHMRHAACSTLLTTCNPGAWAWDQSQRARLGACPTSKEGLEDATSAEALCLAEIEGFDRAGSRLEAEGHHDNKHVQNCDLDGHLVRAECRIVAQLVEARNVRGRSEEEVDECKAAKVLPSDLGVSAQHLRRLHEAHERVDADQHRKDGHGVEPGEISRRVVLAREIIQEERVLPLCDLQRVDEPARDGQQRRPQKASTRAAAVGV
jgi:hypothetical protein